MYQDALYLTRIPQLHTKTSPFVSFPHSLRSSLMADLIRRVVSGHKARHYDADLNLELGMSLCCGQAQRHGSSSLMLDLAYIDPSKKVVVMGYPAVGLEAVYRNRRKDVKRFLEARHNGSFHVFNLCPTNENSYAPNVFNGRVSRYPFPDH